MSIAHTLFGWLKRPAVQTFGSLDEISFEPCGTKEHPLLPRIHTIYKDGGARTITVVGPEEMFEVTYSVKRQKAAYTIEVRRKKYLPLKMIMEPATLVCIANFGNGQGDFFAPALGPASRQSVERFVQRVEALVFPALAKAA